MKKHIVVAAGLAVLSTGAFASKARMSALNQSAELGSFYMDDERNAFRSAGAFSGNYVYLEHGANAANGAGGTVEGGVFREGGSMNYGLYFNSATRGNVQQETASTIDPARVDVFLRSNSGMNWGVRLGYESITRDAASADASGFDFSVNGELGGANVWFTYVPGTDATSAGQSETEADMTLGATHAMGDHTLFAEYDSEGGFDTANNEATTTLTLGAARTHATDSGMWFYDISYVMTSAINLTDGVDRNSLPVTIGFETKATSWLTWRASVQQSLFGSLDSNGSETSARTTTVGVGASLTWGNLRVDGVVQGIDNAAAGAGTLGSDQLLSNVSAVYNF